MNYKVLITKVRRLIDDPTVPPAVILKLLMALVDACSTDSKADMELLDELRPVIDIVRDIIKECGNLK